MKSVTKFLTTITFVLLSFIYCLGQDIELSTQTQVDNFNPTITEIDGNLTISYDSFNPIWGLNGLSNLTSITGHLAIYNQNYLMNLNGLSNLTSIGGTLQLMGNYDLTNINGLSGLTSIGGDLYIGSNIILTNLSGLSNLASLDGYLSITGNDALINLSGLSNLTSVGESLSVRGNDALVSISGLSNITSTGTFVHIKDNNVLTNVDGLSGLTSVGANFVIEYNDVLADCCGIQDILNTPGAIFGDANIHGNLLGCNTENQVTNADCGLSVRIFHDISQNCINDNDETGIANRQLIIQPGDIMGETNAAGRWVLEDLPLGNYTVTIDTSGEWSPTCPITQSFSVTDTSDETISFGLVSTEPCTAPDISIHMPFMRPCFENQRIYIRACNTNDATGALENAFVVLELDSLLIPTSSLIPYTDLGDHMYQFDIGTLNPGICTNFWMETTLSCEAELGQGLCMEANLFPAADCVFDDIPNPFPPSIAACDTDWDLSSLKVDGYCENDSVFFEITNVGLGDMTCFSPVRIYLNGNPIMLDSIQLLSGETATFVFAGEGQSWRLETDQHPLHPGNSQPNAMVEGCGGSIASFLSFVNTMYLDDADPVVDIYCGIVTGSYDPNDKTGFPLGINESNDILPNQQIEYLIRFQNTGTDTAFTVVIRDTLSANFDIFSVQSGVASHPYEFTISDSRAMEWTFNNILLPDSTTNEAGSHGFIKFTVNQLPNLAEETILENTAHIYFDFNDPIITNTSQHTINYFLSDFVMAVNKTIGGCNDNGTSLDSDDDTYEVTINASALNAGLSGTYKINDGTNNLGTFSYETDEIITLPADGNIYTLTFTDTDGGYSVEKEVSQASCSKVCELTITDAIIGECNNNGTSTDPSDDTYEVTVNATAINPGTNNQFTVSEGTTTLEALTYDEGGVITLPADGNIYTLVFSDIDNACFSESQVSQESCSTTATIEVNGESLNYSIFPNPINDNFQIEITGNTDPLDIQIYNSIGQEIVEMEILENSIVNTNTWTNGVYFLIINDKNGKILGIEKVLKTE